MSLSEAETIIILNDADLKEGFFRLSTSKRTTFERVCRRMGGKDKLISLKPLQVGCTTVEWILKIPAKYISTTTMGIRQPVNRRGKK